MKRSEMYRQAAIAVLKDDGLSYDETLDIVELLLNSESMEKWSEKLESEKAPAGETEVK